MTPDQQWTIDYMRSHMNQERLEHAQLLKSAWAWLLPGIAAEVIAAQTYAPTPHWLGLTLFWVGIIFVNVAWMLWERARTAGYKSQARAAFLAQIPAEISVPAKHHRPTTSHPASIWNNSSFATSVMRKRPAGNVSIFP